MNIKLALLEDDRQYGNKFINSFGEFYPQVEIYSFSDMDKAVSAMMIRPVDVVLISESIYNREKDRLREIHCKAVIITVSTKGISKIDDHTALCKYQRVDHLDQAIMKIYSEVSNIVIKDSERTGMTKVITFLAGAGGSGCSSAAAAFSVFLAGKKKKVLYLDLHTFGLPEFFFNDSGNYSMTDCITSVIENKNNLGIQLKNFVRHDKTGVYFYASCENVLDWFDMSQENILTFIKSVLESNEYDYVIIDSVSDWDETMVYLSECSTNLFIVSDGSTFSNEKAVRVWDTAETFYRSQKKDTSKLYLVYSCFAGKAKKINSDKMREFVTLPYISEHHNPTELIGILSSRNYWDQQV